MKKGKKLFGSYLLILFAATIFAGCINQGLYEIEGPNEIEFQDFGSGYYSSLTEKSNFIINDESEWEGFSALLNTQICDFAPDFTKYTLIAVAMGEQKTGGHSIRIQKILEEHGNLYVYIKEEYPSKDDIVSEALTQPYHMVLIEKTSKSIFFRN